ncbi:Helix-turn-helix domain [Mycobacteroides abscessus subsp. abscessus]|nr:Helix-turn-helix domain [Mycobacteroides abscessus subsp. abscessus]
MRLELVLSRIASNIIRMTTLVLVDSPRGRSRDEAISIRLKQELVALGLSVNRAAKELGVSQPWLSRRTLGGVRWKVEEVDDICDKLGLDANYILTGYRSLPDGGDDGGAAGAPTRARTWDLRIISPQDCAKDPQIRQLPAAQAPVEPERKVA